MLSKMHFAVVCACFPALSGVQRLSADTWTGFYGGFQFGSVAVEGIGASAGLDEDYRSFALLAGYNRDLGDWVLGAELDRGTLRSGPNDDNTSLGAVDTLSRLKLRAGFDLGQTMLYATAGSARAETASGNDTGDFYGVGLAYDISNRFVVSSEVLTHDFGDIGGETGQGFDAETLTVRFALRF